MIDVRDEVGELALMINEDGDGGIASRVNSDGIFIDLTSMTFYCSAINYSLNDEKCGAGTSEVD